MMCSLCKNDKNCVPLDRDDIVFGLYLKIRGSKNEVGICADCMENYHKMQKEHQKNIIQYGIAGIVIMFVYLVLTGNTMFAFFFGLLAAFGSVASYCPPLK